jgi:hypothetical protein
LRDLGVEELDLAQAGLDGLALADRQLLVGQPGASLDPEEVRNRRRSLRPRINTAWISFLTRERARTSWARRASRRRIMRTRSSGVQTPSSSPVHSSLASVSRIEAVGLGSGLTNPGVARRDDDHPRDVLLEDCRDRPRVTGHLQRDPVARVRLCANSSSASGRVGIWPADRSRPSATIATSQKSRWTPSATALTQSSSRSSNSGRTGGQNDIDGSALAAQPGKSQGRRPLKSPGSKPIAQNGLPNPRSPEGPCPSRPNLSRPPDDTGPFKEQFHAARSSTEQQDGAAARASPRTT